VASLHVAVASRVLHHALLHVAEAAGWQPTLHGGPGVAVVSDRLSEEWEIDVLVVQPTPLGSRGGMEAVTAGRARAVLCADEPDALPSALGNVTEDWCLLPVRVIELAAMLPVLTGRQREIARAIVAGQPNRMIARGLHVSEATVKREVGILLRTFDAPDRFGLVSQLVPLGVEPHRLTG
jgi:DNA-binding CsgD family transcriptional regulator